MSQTARSGSRTGAPRPLPQPRGTRHAASGEGPPLRRSWPVSDALRSISFLNGVTGLELKDASEQGRPCRVRRGPGRTALLGKREGWPAARRPQTSRRNLLTENQLACLVPKALLQFQLGRCLGDESCPQRPKPGAGGEAGHLCSSAWPRRRVSQCDVKTQTPPRPSPHTQSSAVNNTRWSRGHSLCQTLQGKTRGDAEPSLR